MVQRGLEGPPLPRQRSARERMLLLSRSSGHEQSCLDSAQAAAHKAAAAKTLRAPATKTDTCRRRAGERFPSLPRQRPEGQVEGLAATSTPPTPLGFCWVGGRGWEMIMAGPIACGLPLCQGWARVRTAHVECARDTEAVDLGVVGRPGEGDRLPLLGRQHKRFEHG